MRITMQTIHKNILSNLNTLTSGMNDLNNQISSGRQMSKLSDNPVNLSVALSLRSNLSEIKQYQENLTYGSGRINAAEASLTQIKDLLSRAKVLTIQANNASQTPENRTTIAAEIHQLYEQTIILGNTQLNGKYIFGGYRTSGYTDTEPAPFVAGLIDGHRINGNNNGTINGALNSTVTNTAIAADQLVVNGNNVGAINTAAAVNGLNMTKALNAQTAIETADPSVSVKLTTLYASGTATADTADAADSDISFRLNSVAIDVTIPDGSTEDEVTDLVVKEINRFKTQTGVTAEVGDSTNGGVGDGAIGGALDSIVLYNSKNGDESPIKITDLSEPDTAKSGLVAGVYVPDATHNTGKISISSTTAIAFTSATGDDTILAELGLDGGGIGFADEAGDGELVYGSRLTSGDLEINGYTVGATADDGISTIYADTSAAAKATAINAISSQSGVTAEVVPVVHEGFAPINAASFGSQLTGTARNTSIEANALDINGFAIGAINSGLINNGINYEMAANAKTAVNAQTANTGVTAYLTTLYSGGAATADTLDGSDSTISVTLNSTTKDITIPDGSTADEVATLIATGLNEISEQTGVHAEVGTGGNGGVANSLVLRNIKAGDETAINIALAEPDTARSGLVAGAYDPTNPLYNTGEVSFSSTSSFTINSNPTATVPEPKDSFLDALGLGGGDIGVNDIADDGTLTFDGTTAAVLGPGDLTINGVDIFTSSTAISDLDANNNILAAINAKSTDTGITATVNSIGSIILSAADGRNLHIETSATGEAITNLTNGLYDQVYSGTLRLSSGKEFMLETTPTTSLYEPGLAAIGLDGGATSTGETNDTEEDGLLWVTSIDDRDDSVRYAGDRDNNGEIKVSKGSTLEVTTKGNTALSDTGVFAALKDLENFLRGDHFSEATSIHTVGNTSVTLDNDSSGLDGYDQITDGVIILKITDHDISPPLEKPVSIRVNTATDTYEDIAMKLNGIPNLSAAWDQDGHLNLQTSDNSRYTFAIDGDTSNFLKTVGVTLESMQLDALDGSLAELDTTMENITNQISDFGARANRINVQSQILTNLELAGAESLSEKQDTDITQALMDLKGKQFAYQAALAAASKTMQLSLVDYL